MSGLVGRGRLGRALTHSNGAGGSGLSALSAILVDQLVLAGV
jgi:hypothetical protein